MTSLTALISAYSGAYAIEGGDAEIRGITADSRQVEPGFLFAAIRGAKGNGGEFVADAVAKGAAAVLCDRETPVQAPAPVLRAESARLALALMAARFYGPQPGQIAAVTGTDGKTSTADFFRQLWQFSGEKAAAIGTLGVTGLDENPPPVGEGRVGVATNLDLPPGNPHLTSPIGGGRYPALNTTPDPVLLARILGDLAREGYQHVAMEASSHGLDQFRLDGAALKAAAFTNLTRDHLDYHGTVEAYFAAKKRLFADLLPEGGTAALNADDPCFTELEALCRARGHRILGFGKSGRELRILSVTPTVHGQTAELEILGQRVTLALELYGGFQVMNILAALGLYHGCGGEIAQGLAQVVKLKGVPGRLEKVATHPVGAPVFVDYAHTPAALENILKTLRPHCPGKLHVVFGCGGDRDKGKRPQMGAAAVAQADSVIVTDDNPRSETPAVIRAEILAAAKGAEEIGDRAEAIHAAVKRLQAGDVLVIAGKGHEKTQTYGDKVLPFDDASVARGAVAEVGIRH